MSIPLLVVPRKQKLGLVLLYYFHNTKPDTQKELVSYSLHDSANETYCEPPRQGEIIQPLLNWSKYSPHEGFMEGPEMYRNTVGKTRSQGLKGNGLNPNPIRCMIPEGYAEAARVGLLWSLSCLCPLF